MVPPNQNIDIDLDFHYLSRLRAKNVAWRLLCADNAPFIIHFLYIAFIKPNKRSIAYNEFHSLLDSYLFNLQNSNSNSNSNRNDKKAPSRSAKEYIKDWSQEQLGLLTQRYRYGSDEPELDLTPSVEKAIIWISNLSGRSFIGTESRLLSIFLHLKQLAKGTQEDHSLILSELNKQKEEIDKEIENVKAGIISKHNKTQIKERFFHLIDEARELLSDFRQVEDNFRQLDRQIRQKITVTDQLKGDVLDEIFSEYDAIYNSDQGKSFKAFWEFLIQAPRQEEFEKLLDHLMNLETIQELPNNTFFSRFKDYLLEAGSKVYSTNNMISEQLRKFIDDTVIVENKRIIELVRSIEQKSLKIVSNPPSQTLMELDELKPAINLQLSRDLFEVPKVSALDNVDFENGSSCATLESIYEKDFVDAQRIENNIFEMLAKNEQVSLKDLLEANPPRQGLAEVITYFKLATQKNKWLSTFTNNMDQLAYIDEKRATTKLIELPELIFSRIH
ncbi:MAG: DUF3375 domain-containing protein [Bacteriovoracaceae bacterium]|nr:DUF3375 domain-containing protein [Bacteriovoracaceae bacterium]